VARFCWSMPTVFSRGEWVETRTILCRSVEGQILSVSDMAIFQQLSPRSSTTSKLNFRTRSCLTDAIDTQGESGFQFSAPDLRILDGIAMLVPVEQVYTCQYGFVTLARLKSPGNQDSRGCCSKGGLRSLTQKTSRGDSWC
jgi:hypothetical protein